MSSDKILLVEGVADQNFFQEILRNLAIKATVRVTPPREHGEKFNTKGGVFNTLPILLKQLNDGSSSCFAVVVDADYKSNDGMGFNLTLEKFTSIVMAAGYSVRMRRGSGFLFEHDDGLKPIGLWIMPDNKSEGVLEDWALESAVASEHRAIAYAERMLLNVPGGVKFKLTSQAKAKAALWMAWQAVPGQGLQQAVRDKLIDESNGLVSGLHEWLKIIFL